MTNPIPQDVTVQDALEALDSLDDYARMDTGIDASGPRELLRKFINQRARQVVPELITSGQLNAGANELRQALTMLNSGRSYQYVAKRVHEAMLAAAPQPPQAAQSLEQQAKEASEAVSSVSIKFTMPTGIIQTISAIPARDYYLAPPQPESVKTALKKAVEICDKVIKRATEHHINATDLGKKLYKEEIETASEIKSAVTALIDKENEA